MPLDGQWPPVHASDYVPLILSLSDFSSEEVLTRKINKILKGDIDHVSDELISFADIFSADRNEPDESINSILVQGSPGIGKTAFSLTVCKKWATGDFFTQFSIIILWALRDPHIEACSSVDDLFVHDSKEKSAAVIKEVKQSGGKGVLFVLDGWDELPAKFTQSRASCFFLKLIEGSELPFSSVIVTSRNISSQRFLRQNSFNRSIDILGFSKDCIVEYIRKCFKKNPKNEELLLKLLGERPDLQSICYVPVNCSIVCYVFACKHTLPSTLTELYRLLAKNSLLRNVDLRGSDRESFTSDLDHIPDDAKTLYLSLCKLAYHGLSISRYTYSRNDIAAACQTSTGVVVDVDKLGVLQAVNVFHTEGVSSSFHFLHTTLQEFMAANYLASLNQTDVETVVKSHFSHITFNMVWQFYSGLLANDSKHMKNKFVECLQDQAREIANIDGGFHDRFSYCSSNEEINFSDSDTEPSLDPDNVVEEELSADCLSDQEVQQLEPPPPSSVVECEPSSDIAASAISSTSSPPSAVVQVEPPGPPSTSFSLVKKFDSDNYNMTGCDIVVTAGGLEGVPSTLSNVTAVFFAEVDSYRIDKEKVLFTFRCIYETQSRLLCSSLSNIFSRRFFLSKQSLSPADINAIGFVIARSNQKWQLRLVNCDLNVSHIVMLCHHFLKGGCSGKLTRLYLNENHLDHDTAVELVKMLPALKQLQKLCLGRNNLCDKSFETGAVPELLKGLHFLNSLDLSSNSITDVGLHYLSDGLMRLKALTHLDLSSNSISSDGVKSLACLLSQISLQYLNIGGNPIEDAGIQCLCESLADCSLQLLDVSDTSISDEGVTFLASALQSNSSLQSLAMHSNHQITCDGLGIFLELCVQSNLKTIDLSYCQAGCSENFCHTLQSCIPAFKSLRSLDFSWNDFDDEGMMALIIAVSCSQIERFALGGNFLSAQNLQQLGFVICGNNVLKKLCLNEDDLSYGTEEFDSFCDCIIANISLQIIELYEVDNETILRQRFKQMNAQREAFDKSKVKFKYFCREDSQS